MQERPRRSRRRWADSIGWSGGRRRVVERIFAWLRRCRSLGKDLEKSVTPIEAWIKAGHIRPIAWRQY